MIQSIGFIPDGNRRYAKKQGISLEEAYQKGAKKAREAVEWSFASGAEEVVFWTLSTENLDRGTQELEKFLPLLERNLENLADNQTIHSQRINVKIKGELQKLPESLQETARQLQKKTRNYSNKTLYLGVAYGGRQEILSAVQNLSEKQEPVDEENFFSELQIKTEPDLVIRTSGTKRMSGFMPWQTTYSELKFLDKFWPEITEKDLEKVVNEFQSRERRFGH